MAAGADVRSGRLTLKPEGATFISAELNNRFLIWPADRAPAALRDSAVKVGDRDEAVEWIAYIPAKMAGCEPLWMDETYGEVFAVTHTPPESDADAIQVWSFYDAPEQYQHMSTNGGDEDWLAYVPASLGDVCAGWMQVGRSFGCFCVDEHPLPGGGSVHIGAHS